MATDIDGTILRRDGTVSDRTKKALAALGEAGLHHVLVSGRPPRTLRLVAERLGYQGLAICFNGAVVYNLATESLEHHVTMAAETARQAIAAIRASVPETAFGLEQGLVFSCERPFEDARPTIVNPVSRYGDALDLCDGPVTKIVALHASLSAEALAQRLAPALDGTVAVTYSGPRVLEIGAPGLDKTVGLDWLLERLGLQPEQVIAFGDMPNDLGMLAWAGRGVAVGNAHPTVLAAADQVTASNDDDGVAVVLEGLLASG